MAEIPEASGPVDYPPPPELALIIGNLVMAFSCAETAMHHLTWRILGITLQDGRSLTGRLDAKPKLRLLEELCGRHLKSVGQVEKLLASTKALGMAAEYRNMAAHGDWRTNRAGELFCFSVQYDPGGEGYAVKPCKLTELSAATQDSRTATVALWEIDSWLKETPRGSW